MCNLYALTKGQQALRDFARALALGAVRDDLGNLPVLSALYPDSAAPIIGLARGETVLKSARWGMPSPAFALAGKTVDRGITNIRNTDSPHWRRWLAPPHRCLVPFTCFAEHVKTAQGFQPLWFAPAPETLDDSLACFAGLATRWTGTRKKAEGEVTLTLFGFLTCEPNADVAPHHPKAMPVILTTPDEQRAWLTANWADAKSLQRPLAEGVLRVIDGPPAQEAL